MQIFYVCCPNKRNIIIRETRQVAIPTCNCRNIEVCPFDQTYFINSIVYAAGIKAFLRYTVIEKKRMPVHTKAILEVGIRTTDLL